MSEVGSRLRPFHHYVEPPSKVVQSRNERIMFKAVGFLIVLWGLSHFFSSSFAAFDRAATASFNTLEAAALASQAQLEQL